MAKESDIIASCKYTDKKNKKNTIVINIDKKYKITYSSSEYNNIQKVSYAVYSLKLKGIDYNSFIKNNKINCENIKTVYLQYSDGKDVKSNSSKTVPMIYEISISKSKDMVFLGEYEYSKKDSKIIDSTPDKTATKENNWISVCHYGNITLSFNKTKYEINNPSATTTNSYQYQPQNLMNFLSENRYSCPSALCGGGGVSSHGYTSTTLKFSNEISSNCITSNEYLGKEFKCSGLQNLMDEFDKANNDYKTKNKVEYLNNRNIAVEKIKDFCKVVLEINNYTDSNNCAKECVSINNIIKKRLGVTTSSGKCGFSSNLINWIKNILKWIKYILPALVILLGILDFIKAIASGSDDEMKKAQGRFIKRLIAAALLFIVPALIEFILNIFHIDSAFCGILD